MQETLSAAKDGQDTAALTEHPLFFYLALWRSSHIGSVTFQKCLEYFQTPEAVFGADAALLKDLGMQKQGIEYCQSFGRALAMGGEKLEQHKLYQGIQADLQWTSHAGQQIIHCAHSAYPQQLKQIFDFPPVLFVIGNVDLLARQQLAVVGSRRPSRAGASCAEALASDLAKRGLVISSGLALGVDTHAHEGALAADHATTIAVLAHGLDQIYPRRNQELAARIANGGGALVSEFPVGVSPRPEYFPRRNRIISGLSLGVLVVEAAVKSGSLITAYSALEQNREVFAIPGSIHNPLAKGCHQLIKQGAKLVENADDIIDELPMFNDDSDVGISELNKQNTVQAAGLSDDEAIVWSQLDHQERSINELQNICSMEVGRLSAALTLMELKGHVIVGEQGYMRKPGP